jgi:Uma2 family endonuclease
MHSLLLPPPKTEIEYPESDGKPMADNTLQWEWIVTIKNELETLFWDDPEVFVASDLLWYPYEGNNRTSVAPDVLVAFGRPKGHRGCYMQWKEDGIAPQVVFEILSPNNSPLEMSRKLSNYDQFGVEEYYLFDPDRLSLDGWRREGNRLAPIESMDGWVSPRLRIRFELSPLGLRLYRPDGKPFRTFVEIDREAAALSKETELLAQQRDEERRRAEAFSAKLRELGIDPEALA